MRDLEAVRAYAMIRDFRQRNPAACCLHVVLDDGNLGDSSVLFCLKEAEKAAHPECVAVAVLLGRMSKTQRRKAAR